MVIYERLEVLPSYNALNTFNVCMMVLWRLLSDLSHMGKGQSNCHSGQSLSHCQKYTAMGGGGGEMCRVAMNYGNTSEYTN